MSDVKRFIATIKPDLILTLKEPGLVPGFLFFDPVLPKS